MEDTTPEAVARQNLLDRLLNSVKQVQVYFGARQEIATESDPRKNIFFVDHDLHGQLEHTGVSALCVEWEMVLAHAAKKQKPKNSLRLTGRSEEVTLWPLAKLCVSAEDLVRFTKLSQVTSELGRGRAWLRAAINERTLENYMHTALGQEEQLQKLYEPSAFLLDQERSTMLPIMAAGLSSIIFAITTDASYLNTPSRVQIPHVSPPSPVAEPRLTTEPHTSTRQMPPAVSSVVSRAGQSHDPHSYSSFSSALHTTQVSGSLLDKDADSDMIAVSTKVKKKKQKKSSKTKSGHVNPPPPSLGSHTGLQVAGTSGLLRPDSEQRHSPWLDSGHTQGPDRLDSEREHTQGSDRQDSEQGRTQGPDSDKTPTLKESASSSSSRLSLDSMADDSSAPMYVALATANQLISGEAMAAASATALVLSASSTSPLPAPSASPLLPSSPSTSPSHLTPASEERDTSAGPEVAREDCPQSPNRSSSPTDDMKNAMLTLSKMKDDLELQNRVLSSRVAELQGQLKLLQEELNSSRQELDSEKELQSSHKLALERENDLLREQLKKYVSIVQSQRSSSASESSELVHSGNLGHSQPTQEHSTTATQPTLELATADNCGENFLPTQKPLTTADRKLQDMAEMYGDLMELNERLHRTVADKDVAICALVRSLKEASIELPLPKEQLPAAATSANKVRLVEVWIPSAIKKGRGPDGFHVYQVFVSVKGVEWNVYRRYTEFREFHRQLQKHLPEVAAFNFPPKKAIKNKTSQFVEERRQKLQDYLRFVIKCCSNRSASKTTSNEPILTSNTTKEALVTLFPFFQEDFNQDISPAPQPPSYSGL